MEEEPVWKILNSPDYLIVRVSEALPLLNDERKRDQNQRETERESMQWSDRHVLTPG